MVSKIAILLISLVSLTVIDARRNRGGKNYQLLYDTYPQLAKNDQSQCFKDVTDWLMKIEQPRNQAQFKYGMMGYTDLGSIKACEDPQQGNGSFIQFLAGITDVPIKLPQSFCLPRSCSSASDLAPLAAKLEKSANSAIDGFKSGFDLNNLRALVPPNKIGSSLVIQLTGLIFNETQVSIMAEIPSENQYDQEQASHGIFVLLMVLSIPIMVLFVCLPNLHLCIRHFMEAPEVALPEQLQVLTEQQESQEKSEIIKQDQDKIAIEPLAASMNKSPLSQFEGGRRESATSAGGGQILQDEQVSHLEFQRNTEQPQNYVPPRINQTMTTRWTRSSAAPSRAQTEGGPQSQHNAFDVDGDMFTYEQVEAYGKGSFLEKLHAFNWSHMHRHLSGTRCKIWDDRELDVLEGYKVISFLLYTVAQTALTLFYTQLVDLLQVFALLDTLSVNLFICSNLGLETFIFLSAFMGFHKSFQIMDAQDGELSFKDILKIYARKFLRLAPVYYGMWLFIWGLTASIGKGPLWHTTNMNMQTCKTDWIWTFLFLGNIFPNTMVPYTGCYQQAWPLQIDMQIALIIPPLAIVYYKRPTIGFIVSAVMIFANIVINMIYTYHYGLTIGVINHGQYYLLQAIIGKPWTKLQNIAQAGIMAIVYHRILKYRKLNSKMKEEQYPWIHYMKTSKLVGPILSASGGLIVCLNLVSTRAYNQDPQLSSKFANAVYYGLSRPSFVLGGFLVLLAIFLGHFAFAKALLSLKPLRLVAKSLGIACVLQILLIELLFCSDASPSGISLTFPTALIFGLGFHLTTLSLSLFLMICLEFPMTRLHQLIILPHISHDTVLRKHHYTQTYIESNQVRITRKSEFSALDEEPARQLSQTPF